MTFRIDARVVERRLILQLVGDLRIEHLDALKAQIEAATVPDIVLDVSALALISVEGIRFLNACDSAGIAVENPCPYISEWMTLERKATAKDA